MINKTRVSRTRAVLNGAASMAALTMVLTATPAAAQDAGREPPPGTCDQPARGVVDCKSEHGPFDRGISHSNVGDLTINLEDGLTVEPDAGFTGLYARSDSGSVSINGQGANVTATDATAVHVEAVEDLTINIGQVATSGDNVKGIDATNVSGKLTINAASVSTSGSYGLGVVANSRTGDIDVTVGEIVTNGFAADGVTTKTFGDTVVNVGSIKGSGDYVWGVNTFSGGYDGSTGQIHTGNAIISVGQIEINGNNAAGVVATSYGYNSVSIGSLKISGTDGSGVVSRAINGNSSIAVGTATFEGYNTGGIFALSEYGKGLIDVGEMTVEHGGGITASGATGAEVRVGSIRGNIAGSAFAASAASGSGLSFVRAGDIKVTGSGGVFVRSEKGDGRVVANSIESDSVGVDARGFNTSIQVGSIRTHYNFAHGLFTSTYQGESVVRVNSIETSGYGSLGAAVVSRYGDADIAIGSVKTSGEKAVGIRAIGEDASVKITVNTVQTSGAKAHGIEAKTRYVQEFAGRPNDPPIYKPFVGDIDIKAGSVAVSGEGAIGIRARGLENTRIDVGSVTSTSGNAIDVDTVKEARLAIRGEASSSSATAVNIVSADAVVDVGSGAKVHGEQGGIVIDAIGPRRVERAPMDGRPNPYPGPGDEFDWTLSRASGQSPTGQSASSPGTVSINNAGSISAGNGTAIWVKNGTATINNSGTISGAIRLADGDDTITNSGTWVLSADNDFGAGSDRLINSGTIKLNSAAQALNVTLLNLERFENSNLIDLRNGRAGDVLTTPGDYVGSGNATLGLDVSYGANASDKFVVGGAATGRTKIALTSVSPSAGRLTGDNPIELVKVGVGSDSNAFVLDPEAQEIGFVRYWMKYDSAGSRYLLTSRAGSATYRLLNVAEGAENAWEKTTDALSTRLRSLRDLDWASGGSSAASGLWGQLLGGDSSRGKAQTIEEGDDSAEVDLDYRQSYFGGQVGYDFVGTTLSARGGVSFGVTAGYQTSDLTMEEQGEKAELGSANIGLYANLVSDSVFASGLVKYDRHSVKASSAPLEYDEEISGQTFGAELEAGYRLGGDRFFVEPVAGLSWLRTDLGDLSALGQRIDFDTRSGLRGKAGARAGGAVDLGRSGRLVFSGGAEALHAFNRRSGLTLHSGDESEHIRDEDGATFFRGSFGLSWLSGGSLETYLQGQGDFGDDHEGVGGVAGIRLKL